MGNAMIVCFAMFVGYSFSLENSPWYVRAVEVFLLALAGYLNQGLLLSEGRIHMAKKCSNLMESFSRKEGPDA